MTNNYKNHNFLVKLFFFLPKGTVYTTGPFTNMISKQKRKENIESQDEQYQEHD